MPATPVMLGSDALPFQASVARPTPDDAERLRFAVESFVLMCRHFSCTNSADASTILSAFHSVVEPSIGLAEYVMRLDKHTNCGEEGVYLGMIIAVRYCVATKLLPSVLSMHRLILIGTRIGTKAHHDIFRSNRSFARAGGLELREVNDLELLMLSAIDYHAVVFNAEMTRLRNALKTVAGSSDRVFVSSTLAKSLDPKGQVLVVSTPLLSVPLSSSPHRRAASGNASAAARLIRTNRSMSSSSNTTSDVNLGRSVGGQSSLLGRSFQFAEQSMSLSGDSVLRAPPPPRRTNPTTGARNDPAVHRAL